MSMLYCLLCGIVVCPQASLKRLTDIAIMLPRYSTRVVVVWTLEVFEPPRGEILRHMLQESHAIEPIKCH